ncbi:YciI family protein [Allokutzneria sp. NRRL B-24872]|uniref:YciI family protein n=1 Tax=Allokutzneria sp. NRRL B-24872 TaxID=1137961 RepID=UPI000A3B27BB|nr:YciI family protein [Allokutzneria sp. NRRL B-24872]
MRFMVMVKADARSEAGQPVSAEVLAALEKYNEDLVNAGVLLAGEVLKPSSCGARVRFSGARRTVVDGPFPAARDLLAGFWLIDVKSLDEAIAWVGRIPCGPDSEAEVEVRPVVEVAASAPAPPGLPTSAPHRLRPADFGSAPPEPSVTS